MFLLELMCHPIEQYAMVSGHGRGCDRGRNRDFRGGRGSFGGGHILAVVDRPLVIRSPGNVSIRKGITASLRNTGRSLVALNGNN